MTARSDDRPLKPALLYGLLGRCPACGSAPLFHRFLKPAPRCRACAQDWSHQQADDFPAYLVILVVGHLLVPMVVSANSAGDLPMGLQMLLWPALALALSLLLIQPFKGAVIAWQWSRRMHGF